MSERTRLWVAQGRAEAQEAVALAALTAARFGEGGGGGGAALDAFTRYSEARRVSLEAAISYDLCSLREALLDDVKAAEQAAVSAEDAP